MAYDYPSNWIVPNSSPQYNSNLPQNTRITFRKFPFEWKILPGWYWDTIYNSNAQIQKYKNDSVYKVTIKLNLIYSYNYSAKEIAGKQLKGIITQKFEDTTYYGLPTYKNLYYSKDSITKQLIFKDGTSENKNYTYLFEIKAPQKDYYKNEKFYSKLCQYLILPHRSLKI